MPEKRKRDQFPGSFVVYGRNPVSAAIDSKRIRRLFVSPKKRDDILVRKALSIPVEVGYMEDGALGDLCHSGSHQGFVAVVPEMPEISLQSFLSSLKKADPVLLILDGIEDPNNLGSLLRSADALGASAIIIKSRGQTPLTPTVAKVSTGAYNYVPVISVPNLSGAIRELKKNGFWIVATDGSGTLEYDEIDYSGPIAVVIGSEGFGVSRLVRENSDFIAKIPMVGHVNSLNAAVAGALFLGAINIKRKQKK